MVYHDDGGREKAVVEDHLNGVQGKIFSFEGEGYIVPPKKEVQRESKEVRRPPQRSGPKPKERTRPPAREPREEELRDSSPLEVEPQWEDEEQYEQHDPVGEEDLQIEWSTTEDEDDGPGPDDIPRLLELGRTLCSEGSYRDAQACFDRILAIDEMNHEAWNERGVALWSQDKPQSALESYERALQIEPGSIEAWINRGVACNSMGKREDALECYDKALTLSPESIEACSNKGVTLFQLERYREAERCFSQLTRFEPRDPEAWLYRGFTLERMGDEPNARRCYEMVVELDPQNEEALRSLDSLKVEKWD